MVNWRSYESAAECIECVYNQLFANTTLPCCVASIRQQPWILAACSTKIWFKPTLFTSLHVISCANMCCPKAHNKELLTSAGNNFTTVPIIIKLSCYTHCIYHQDKGGLSVQKHANPSAAGMRSNTGDSLLWTLARQWTNSCCFATWIPLPL